MQQHILKLLFVLIWVLALANGVAEHLFLYWTYRWLDIPMHFLGGTWVGLAGVWVWRYAGYVRPAWSARGHVVTVACTTGLLLGIVWELYEYVVWYLTGTGLPANYLPDTELDVVMDVAGALTAGLLVSLAQRRTLVEKG